jgi:CRISPR-associated endoribonuclease Cas6
MRLLVKLKSLIDSKYEMQYHYHLQSFIYDLLKGSKFHYLHDKQGYKFFCFSNIFPVFDLHVGDLRTLIISSPDDEFIRYINNMFKQLNKRQTIIKIGSMRFQIENTNEFHSHIYNESSLNMITGTPIIIRIHRERYQQFGFKLDGQYAEVYWRIDHPIMLFIQQLESNLLKKYYEYHKYVIKDFEDSSEIVETYEIPKSQVPFIQRFKFKKQIATRVFIKDNNHIILGTLWEFVFDQYSIDKRLIEFALDCGLGERNSLGFGFMNLKI